MHDRKARATSDYGAADPGDALRAFTLQDLERFVRLRSWTILLPVLLALAAVFAYVQFAVPTYTARAQIIIDPRLPQFIPGHNEETLLAWDSAQVESEIAVLQSERIAAAVVSKLGLDKANDFRDTPTIVDRLRSFLMPGSAAPLLEPDRFRGAIGLVQAGLSVRRAGLSYAIDISFAFPDPLRSMEVANSVAESYITDQIENRSQAARVGGEWLKQRMILLKAQMNVAAQAVQVFRAGHNYAIVPPVPDDPASTGAKTSPSSSAAPEDKTLDELEASASTYRRIYESFLQSFTESVQRQSFPVSDARILTPASLPRIRSAPRGLLIYALGVMIGGLVGLGLALVQHHLDRTIRSASEAADASGLEELGTLPRVQSGLMAKLRRRARRWGRPRSAIGGGTGTMIRDQIASKGRGRRRSLARYILAGPDEGDPAFLTALRTVRVLTELQVRRRNLKTVGITAPHRGSGTSTLVSQLGMLFADCGKKVLIIDADFEDRDLTRQLGRADRAGLAEVLQGAAPFDQSVVSFKGTSLDFLGASAAVGAKRGCGVVAEPLRLFIEEVAPRYDLVLVDLPPILPVGEVVAIGAVLDGVMLVVEWGSTSADAVFACAASLDRAQARALGFVLSKASP